MAVEAKALGLHAARTGVVQDYGAGHLAVLSGMGSEAAIQAGRMLLAAGADVLLSVGTAGALHADLQAGDLCIPEQILWQEGAYPVDVAWASGFSARYPQARRGNLLSVDRVLVDPQTKALHAQAALAVDMESGALAALAVAQGRPFFALRVIVDSADSGLPDAVRYGVDALGRPRLPAFLWQLLARPQDLPQLIKLGRQMQKAEATLRHLRSELERGGSPCEH
ncbi:5'-methylthioadenosine nucleosidase [Acidithiobacillus sp. IBUN Pt1247-S3]